MYCAWHMSCNFHGSHYRVVVKFQLLQGEQHINTQTHSTTNKFKETSQSKLHIAMVAMDSSSNIAGLV